VFSALHDQLASLGRHAQLTRCFSAVAELLVIGFLKARPHWRRSQSRRFVAVDFDASEDGT